MIPAPRKSRTENFDYSDSTQMDGFGVLLWKYLDAIQTGPNDDCPCAASQVVDVEKALPRAAPRQRSAPDVSR
jgi:hypothetical protein